MALSAAAAVATARRTADRGFEATTPITCNTRKGRSQTYLPVTQAKPMDHWWPGQRQQSQEKWPPSLQAAIVNRFSRLAAILTFRHGQ